MGRTTVVETDLLIVGSGVAGAYAALTASDLGASVLLVTKGALLSGSTPWAQGGIAFPDGDADIASHLSDTLKAGRGLSDKGISSEILEESLDHLRLLVDLGMKFDPGLALEGGHSKPRVMHAGGDRSGLMLLKFLHSKLGGRVKSLERHFVYSLHVDDEGVTGAYAIDESGELLFVRSLATILATGGSGQLFTVTTNPTEATGDGVALGLRAGAVLRDIELEQFHPTALVDGTLISEACRGDGAILVNADGDRFMGRYDRSWELAPRDVVARAVYEEAMKSGGVYLDLRPVEGLADHFPTVYESVLSLGLNPSVDLVPVAPAVHYQMGGLRTDGDGHTAVRRLFAAGEVGSTGLHGANRLASNSLLEGLVMGARSATAAVKELDLSADPVVDFPVPMGIAADRRAEIKSIMSETCSVVRTGSDLERGLGEIKRMGSVPSKDRFEIENANLALLAECVLLGAAARTESRGSHFRLDYPEPASTPFHVDQTMTTLSIVPEADGLSDATIPRPSGGSDLTQQGVTG